MKKSIDRQIGSPVNTQAKKMEAALDLGAVDETVNVAGVHCLSVARTGICALTHCRERERQRARGRERKEGSSIRHFLFNVNNCSNMNVFITVNKMHRVYTVRDIYLLKNTS